MVGMPHMITSQSFHFLTCEMGVMALNLWDPRRYVKLFACCLACSRSSEMLVMINNSTVLESKVQS